MELTLIFLLVLLTVLIIILSIIYQVPLHFLAYYYDLDCDIILHLADFPLKVIIKHFKVLTLVTLILVS